MGIIIYNRLGVGIIFVAGLIGALLSQWMGRLDSFKSPVFLLATGIIMVVLDVWYRVTREDASLVHWRRGGQLFFIPVWTIGGFLILFNFFEALTSGPYVSARQSSPYAKASTSQKSPPAFAYAPEPSYRSLKLGMISGVGSNRIATINGQPFAQGETHALTIDSTKRVVQCTEIRDQSVLLTFSGDSQPRELKIGEPLLLNRR
jgi:hypothetical protein